MPIGYDASIHVNQIATAIQTRDHLIRFLNASGREFFVMRSEDLVKALPEPFGDVVEDGKVVQEGSVTYIQNLVSCYRDYRGTLETGRVDVLPPPSDARIPVMKGETLEPSEYDELIEWAQREKKKLVDKIDFLSRKDRGVV